MTTGRPARVAVLGAVVVLAATGCAQATAGSARPNDEAADAITVEAGITAFQEHFEKLGDEHAKVYNFLNYGDIQLTTEHESRGKYATRRSPCSSGTGSTGRTPR